MREERDPASEPTPDSNKNQPEKPNEYYYDDSTGYEVYDPEENESEE
jgi:ribosomal 30S subunit maturation factor RimM